MSYTDLHHRRLRRPAGSHIVDRVRQIYWLGHQCLLMHFQRRRTRRHLAMLDDAQLGDIGVTRRQALREIRKSFRFYTRPGRQSPSAWR